MYVCVYTYSSHHQWPVYIHIFHREIKQSRGKERGGREKGNREREIGMEKSGGEKMFPSRSFPPSQFSLSLSLIPSQSPREVKKEVTTQRKWVLHAPMFIIYMCLHATVFTIYMCLHATLFTIYMCLHAAGQTSPRLLYMQLADGRLIVMVKTCV